MHLSLDVTTWHTALHSFSEVTTSKLAQLSSARSATILKVRRHSTELEACNSTSKSWLWRARASSERRICMQVFPKHWPIPGITLDCCPHARATWKLRFDILNV